MNEQNVYLYNGMLFNHKNESSTETCHNIDDSCKHHVKYRNLVSKGLTFQVPFISMSTTVKSIEKRSRFVVVEGWGLVK